MSLIERYADKIRGIIVEIEFIRKANIRKEDIIARVLEHRGTHPGLVHILICHGGLSLL